MDEQKTKTNKWCLHRAGLLNFWYYDEQVFHFGDGKLLLRGSNGSGKSVTMQSFLPLLLDGKKSPDRLDPFGSRARKIEDYLLGEKDVVNRDERTGYLYLECKRAHTDQYLTFGIGLRARRQRNLDFWGFVILDNRRVDIDFMLYKTEYNPEDGAEQKIPLTKKELENRLQNGGAVVHSQGEYMQLVNKHVFGFSSVDAYKELIELLIQLRSPKLSKDFKPTVIYEILNASLPALSDEELRPLSDTIENMDQTKQQLDQLKQDEQSLKKLCKQYDQYNRLVLLEKAEGYIQADRRVRQIDSQLKQVGQEMRVQKELLEQQTEQQLQLKDEQLVLQQEEDELKQHDVFKAEKEKELVRKSLHELRRNMTKKEDQLEAKKKQEFKLDGELRLIRDKEAEAMRNQQETIELLHTLADEAAFSDQHELACSAFERAVEEKADFTMWKHEAVEHEKRLQAIYEKIREQIQAKDKADGARRELGEAQQSLDEGRYTLRKWEELLAEEKDLLLQLVHRWIKHNEQLRFDEDQTRNVARTIVQLYDTSRPDDVSEAVRQVYHQHENRLAKERLSYEQTLQKQMNIIAETEAELTEWQQKEDPEPERHPDTVEARKYLDEAGIPYVPFYAAVEFQEHIRDDERERLEAAISEIGFLDALIVPAEYQQRVHALITEHDAEYVYDRIIRPRPQMFAHTLADVLFPTPGEGAAVTAEHIDDALRTVMMEAIATNEQQHDPAWHPVVREDGYFSDGITEGHAPRNEQATYIGKEARMRFRRSKIHELQQTLAGLEEEKCSTQNDLGRIDQQHQSLQEEWNAFPSLDNVREAYDEWEKEQKNVQIWKKQVHTYNEKMKKADETYQRIRQETQRLSESLNLPVDEDAVASARQGMQAYIRDLNQLELETHKVEDSRTRMEDLEQMLHSVQDDVDEYHGELNVLTGEERQFQLRLVHIEERLQELGADDIRKRIQEVVQRLDELPGTIESITVQKTNTQNLLEQLQREKNDQEHHFTFYEQMRTIWQHIFVEDERMAFMEMKRLLAANSEPVDDAVQAAANEAAENGVHVSENEAEMSGEHNEQHVLQRAKDMVKQLKTSMETSMNRDKVTERLIRIFTEERDRLIEYQLTREESHEWTEFPDAVENETWQIQIDHAHRLSRRLIVHMDYQGKRVSPYYALEQIGSEIQLQDTILQEKDRELYEEIIMNSVGRIIRTRINRAEKWVKQMNQLMAERDNSSGLTFSIRWKPKTADDEAEMDTQELVSLLRADAKLLREEDMDQVIRHFRSKINRAKEVVEERGYGETFHQIIREILDYRRWFDFTLYYRKEGETRKELTNNVFFTFSGGEKAMAMYIPLFSAAYSRYLEAHPDAPYIISLDEAFAGVDENNIRDMFALVEKLGFNYMINSQALWGDYDTVSALSIAELVRPKNAPYVTVIPYYWDGRKKHLVDMERGMPYETIGS